MNSKPRQWWQEMPDHYQETTRPALTVFPSDPVNTGILDANGNPIMRDTNPIGFLKNPHQT